MNSPGAQQHSPNYKAQLATRRVTDLLTIVPATRPVIYRAGLFLGGIGKTTASVIDAIVVAIAHHHLNPATVVTVDPGDLGLLASLTPGITIRAL